MTGPKHWRARVKALSATVGAGIFLLASCAGHQQSSIRSGGAASRQNCDALVVFSGNAHNGFCYRHGVHAMDAAAPP